MRVECCVESLVLQDDDEDVPDGRHWSATLLCECIRRAGCHCGARERGGEKASLTGTHHETKGGLLSDRRRSPLHERIRLHAFSAPSILHGILYALRNRLLRDGDERRSRAAESRAVSSGCACRVVQTCQAWYERPAVPS